MNPAASILTAISNPQAPNSRAQRASVLQKKRLQDLPAVPNCLKGPVAIVDDPSAQTTSCSGEFADRIAALFPTTNGQPVVRLVPHPNPLSFEAHTPMRVGVVLSGGQAPGGHNVIAGVYDYVKKANPNSQLFGFLRGPAGVFGHKYVEINDGLMNEYRNMGGFDMILSGRHKIETTEQKHMSLQIAKKLSLHGIVVIGGDDSNTNAAILAEFFEANGCSTRVVGCPKTIDGDLKNEYVETSFGFDTAVKTYAEFIGNLCTDVATSGKYYHFVRLMGRSASNITLQCALLTRPNLTFIGEEVKAKDMSLKDVVEEIVQMVLTRQGLGKDFGVVLIPEGLVEFIPEVGRLIQDINGLLGRGGEFEVAKLEPQNAEVFESLPLSIREQFLLDRDPHGNVQVSRIPTERLLILMAKDRLVQLGKADRFTPRSHFFGYEGRAGMPSLFDSNYCYALGQCAAALIDGGRTGYMATMRGLQKPVEDWEGCGCPLSLMMTVESRKGKDVPVIKKYLVELDKSPFTLFAEVRDKWVLEDMYCCPGPIQFEGPCASLVNFSVISPKKEDLLPERDFGFESLRHRHFFPKSESQMSPLQYQRVKAPVTIPAVLSDRSALLVARRKFESADPQTQAAVARSFPLQCRENRGMTYNATAAFAISRPTSALPLARTAMRIGVLLNGQQSPGVANVIVGLWERLLLETPSGRLIGFLHGPHGLLSNPPSWIEINREDIEICRNQGGLTLLGRSKEAEMVIATREGLDAARRVCRDLKLTGLVLIGGRHTLTDVAVVTEDFYLHEIPTRVIGVPATQNNNVESTIIESAIGFDSAAKCYNQLIGNLNTDGASCAKYWLFVRLMGADKSQIAVECALTTQPNIVLVSEAYAAGDKTLQDVVSDIADVVVSRASQGMEFGTVVIPEGIISSLPQFRQLISELKLMFATIDAAQALRIVEALVRMDDAKSEVTELSPWSRALLKSLPEYFRSQLVQPRSLGSLELTKVATEELLADMVTSELRRRERLGQCSKFNFVPLCFYFGYQGRSSLPSKFDCSLAFSHGSLAALAIKSGLTGYVTTIRGLAAPPAEWLPCVYPVTSLLKLQSSTESDIYPLKVPMVPSDMVRLHGKVYQELLLIQQKWEAEDHYVNPGPIQFEGEAADVINETLRHEHKDYLDMLAKVHESIAFLRQMCGSGASEHTLSASVGFLSFLKELYHSQGADDLPGLSL